MVRGVVRRFLNLMPQHLYNFPRKVELDEMYHCIQRVNVNVPLDGNDISVGVPVHVVCDDKPWFRKEVRVVVDIGNESLVRRMFRLGNCASTGKDTGEKSHV